MKWSHFFSRACCRVLWQTDSAPHPERADKIPPVSNPDFQNDPAHASREQARWGQIYGGDQYFYGQDAGPVARRAVRYHQPLRTSGLATALDTGCGEGQDVAYLAECGYIATGLDFVANAAEKARRLIALRGLMANIIHTDLREWPWDTQYDLVLAVNSLQFLADDAPPLLERVMNATKPGGVLGLSLFACEGGEEVRGGIYFSSLQNLQNRLDHQGENRSWQLLETARLWQWNTRENAPQPFVTIIAQRLR